MAKKVEQLEHCEQKAETWLALKCELCEKCQKDAAELKNCEGHF